MLKTKHCMRPININ